MYAWKRREKQKQNMILVLVCIKNETRIKLWGRKITQNSSWQAWGDSSIARSRGCILILIVRFSFFLELSEDYYRPENITELSTCIYVRQRAQRQHRSIAVFVYMYCCCAFTRSLTFCCCVGRRFIVLLPRIMPYALEFFSSFSSLWLGLKRPLYYW